MGTKRAERSIYIYIKRVIYDYQWNGITVENRRHYRYQAGFSRCRTRCKGMPNVVSEINTPRREHVAAAVRYRHRLVLFTCIPRRVHVSATNVISIQSRFHFPAGRRRCQPTFRNKSPPSRVCAIPPLQNDQTRGGVD